jgi:hypothetical protein
MSFERLSPEFRDSLRSLGDKLATKASGKEAFLAYVSAAYDELYESRNDPDKEMMRKASSSNPGVVIVALAMKAMKGEGAKTP